MVHDTRAACRGGARVQSTTLHSEGLQEALKHKWIESQKRGTDLGQSALDEWYARYWPLFCRNRLVEHVCGDRPCNEFDERRFGLIARLIRERDLLLELILDRARCGLENLDIILWAREWGMPMERVIAILEQLDLNRARLDPHYGGA